ncbi:hypothetical protein AGABI1DRAFT_112151 [Agaricus bisporus var. burnettii JB137-S8]|uniref:Programmed cell death protein 2 C-terminal domain-containing protein n=1 Tax=Agaricus bisporus var. burnettii (strain JB137-S8 / ATCC MYA-4627 / FGSC 10392) TaxID=597362 RepID=K5X2D0_AGABU|nr:uncharacterized protein AGABI1DRAFT_112151 [Agaricus bisporus var. burnettii JB137-S8]EKM81971.1 hypothetical protein AGABI1DRAFT_112151 [Agaricus bisporus var. burnettii JB137-S8]
MPDWSDDDDDELAGVETKVLLGVPDGLIDDPADITDAAVSRIGGHPAFLPSREPSFESSLCKVCSFPMHLLLQIWCPFEDSPRDRALYVWGCSRGGCQKKDGSIRAWRGLRFNDKYAAKLEKKLAIKKEREKAKAAEQSKPKTNPFAISTSALNTPSNPFALGNQIFGASNPPPVAPSPSPSAEEPVSDGSDTDDESDSSQQSLTVALAAATLDDSPWKATSAYDPLYLSTTSEYLPPVTQPKLPPGVKIIDPDNESKSGTTWSEAYENSLDIDHVFERFVKRVSHESEQCLRYELGGTPLPFAKDDIFDRLFSTSTSNITTVTKSAFTVTPRPNQQRNYSPPTNLIPPCSICKSPRIFECQLMPNLINILKNTITSTAIATSDQPGDQDQRRKKTREQMDGERKKAVEEALKGGGDGMSWGTVMIFSCEKDCCYVTADMGEESKECWREECVIVQWDM